MTTIHQLGWRPQEDRQSQGQDFLGLASGHDAVLVSWTPGLTNATRRAKYLSFVPWAIWRYLERGGRGTGDEQEEALWAHEAFLAYANVAYSRSGAPQQTGVIRSDHTSDAWDKGGDRLPIRGASIPTTPSALQAVNYGPSLERLGLILRLDDGVACPSTGQLVAKTVDEVWGSLPGARALLEADSVPRRTIEAWAPHLALDNLAPAEVEILRDVLLARGAFANDRASRRVSTLRLLLYLVEKYGPFRDSGDLERTIAAGTDERGRRISPPADLELAFVAWRIITLLKLLRRAAEGAFWALHGHLQSSAIPRYSVTEAAQSLLTLAHDSIPWRQHLRRGSFGRSSAVPGEPTDWTHAEVLATQIRNVDAICTMLKRERETGILGTAEARSGLEIGASLVDWDRELAALEGASFDEAGQWLLTARGTARHFRVAARKLEQHDTYRLRLDESGLEARGDCPVSNVAIRVDAMLSLLCDLRLVRWTNAGLRVMADGSSVAAGRPTASALGRRHLRARRS